MSSATHLWSRGDQAGAAAIARQVLDQSPLHPQANELLAAAAAGAGKWDEAVQCLDRAARGDPRDPHLQFALGCAHSNRGNPAAAATAFRSALSLEQAFDAAILPLGMALIELGSSSEAESVLRRGLARQPLDLQMSAALAMVLADRARTDQSIALLKPLLAKYPANADLLVLIRQWLNCIDESGEAEASTLRERQLRIFGKAAPWPRSTDANFLDPDRLLRIGYLSPDFRRHSVAYFIEPLLANHDRARFDIFCYSTGDRADSFTSRLRMYPGAWREGAGADDSQLVNLIRRDRIDILIELSGLTTGNRLSALAQRCAPIQVTYIGCPSSTGVAAIDYRLVDAVTDPTDRHATERLERVPGCFLCYRPPHDAPDPSQGTRAGNPITFGSFNSLGKLSPQTARLWAGVLAAVPDSRLLLKGKALADAAAQASVREVLARAGIAAERTTLLADIPDARQHLAAYARMDIALDPTPYNGTTTTCEALWMGVPVVTLRGRLHASRVGASLLTAAGHPELIAETSADYAQLGASLAGDRERLAHLRATLRDDMQASRLCDAALHTREIEACFRRMWRDWLARS